MSTILIIGAVVFVIAICSIFYEMNKAIDEYELKNDKKKQQ
jgi:hypothetical protein